ncbi:MAG: Do family serine endopeptidase [Cyclobacteriaceae bacterium]|nr:Do family serine endopeptidase [Cyclobacteriaceae bacterium]
MKNVLKLISAALIGGVLSIGIWRAIDEPGSQIRYVDTPTHNAVQASYNANAFRAPMDFDFTSAAEKTIPSVVHIRSTVKETPSMQQLQIPESFRDFFGGNLGNNLQQKPEPEVASGSGVIIRPDGYIVTNNHVVAEASKIEVTLNDNRTFNAEVVGTDPNTDMALIRIDAKDLPSMPIGDSDAAKVGEWVLAVGNPFNLESTVTAGIVSAKGRNINIYEDRSAIESFIQTDAAINPGNSGGALVDLNGNLIGINTAIATPTGVYAGYGFAVPSNLMKKVIDDLINYGKVQRAYLGVMIHNLDSKLAKEKNISINEGIYVDSVMEEGAANTAGIKPGDVITKLDENAIKSSSQLQEGIARHKPGDKINLTIFRQGKEKTINVDLKNNSGNTEITKAYKDDILKGLGAEFENLSKGEKAKLGLEGKGGVKVIHLNLGKLTQQTDIQEGFIITSVNNKAISNVDDLIAELKRSNEGVLIQGIYPQNPNQKVFYGFSLS